jgi:3,4-dihydroxy 2-butanone 4-phosphate synthase/GTP cyclohydrolase II
MSLAKIEQALEAIRNGDMIILVDDEDRENEGDLCMAAEKVTPAAINFMAKHGRGLICLSMTEKRLETLDIPMMVQENTSPRTTAFAVSIEARDGVTTGISAADRARTIQVAVDEKTRPEELSRPGHVFPLRAAPGGVLVRTGHTEGSVDLSRLAGLKPSGVICEVMGDDGEMARLPELLLFAEKHGLLVVSIAELVEFRLKQDCLVERLVTAPLENEMGRFELMVFRSLVDGYQHYAIVAGGSESLFETNEPVLVRVHRQSLASDVFHAKGGDNEISLIEAMTQIYKAGNGVVVYLCYPENSRPECVAADLGRVREGHSISQIGESYLKDKQADSDKPKIDLRQYGVGAQILRNLGVSQMRLLTTRPKNIVGLSGYGLEVVEQVTIDKDNLKSQLTEVGKIFDISTVK